MSHTMTVTDYVIMEGVARWLSCLIFIRPLPKRKGWGVWAVVMLIVGMVMGEEIAEMGVSNARVLVFPIAGLVYGLAMGGLCTRSRLSVSLYFGIWAVLTHCASFELWQFMAYYLGQSQGLMLTASLWDVVVLAGYAVICFTVQLWMPVYHTDHVGPRQTISAVMLYVIFVALMLGFYEQGVFLPRGAGGMVLVMAQVYCFTVLYLQSALFRKSAITQELETMKLLWNQQQAQYEKSKESIAIINQKCHDLKHQLAVVRSVKNSTEQERYFQEIHDSVDIYDSIYQTGSETLDTVLTEKALRCRAGGIRLNCVADGAKLSFMNAVDVYTIMGNALDNAIEAVQQVAEPERRFIDVLIYARGNLLVVSITNPLVGELSFEDGIPHTTKGDNGYHGFGMRGMRSTVRRYGGELKAEVEGGCFALKIILPL